jgi:hypothetical protein
MTCIRIAVSVAEPVPVSWLHSVSPAGPRSRRIRSLSEEACGVATPTATNSTPAGLPVMDRQAFDEALLLAQREALIATARHLRDQRRSKAASEAERELRQVTTAILRRGASIW